MDDQFICIIAKGYMFKRHFARHCAGRSKAGVGGLFFFIEKFKDAFRCGDGLLECIGDGGKLRDGLGKISHILDEGLDIANFNDLFYRQVASHNANNHIADIADKLHHRHHDACKKL